MDTLENVASQSEVVAEDGGFSREIIAKPPGWSPLIRLGFRIAFIYFCGFMWLYGSDGADENAIVMWRGLGNVLNWPLNHLAILAGHYVFHLKNLPAHWHVTHRGDTLINWVLDKLLIVAALAGGLTWTAIARLRGSSRTEYRTLLAWLRFFLRLTVGFFMIAYGMLKVFPLQMPPISLGILNQPAGQMAPHTLLWSMVGLFPAYESICGLVEVTAGALVLFRRTALAGALLTVFVMGNVVIYDFFFGVSVKLFALNLLLAAIFIVLPDAKPLIDFFWRGRSVAQTGIWTPPLTRRGVRVSVRIVEVVFIVASFTVNPLFDGAFWHYTRVVARIPSPLLGGWRLDSTPPATGAFNTPKGPVTEIYVDTVQHALARSADGALWRTVLRVNATAHTVWINPFLGEQVTYAWRMPDANHLILTAKTPNPPMQGSAHNSKPASPSAPAVVTLTRIPLPTHYPLLDSKFHFVAFN